MKAFDEIYKLYAVDVFRYLICLTGNEDLSEELTQDTFYKAYKNIDSFRGDCRMYVWLCQIAKNSYFSHIRKSKLEREEVLDDKNISKTNVHEEFILANVIAIHKILHSLEEPYKEVFTLRHFGELSYGQISEIFGKSESWARVTYYRAKERIRAVFNEKEELK